MKNFGVKNSYLKSVTTSPGLPYRYLLRLVFSQLAHLWQNERQNRVFPIDLRVKRTLPTKVRRGWDLVVVERNGFQIRLFGQKEVILGWLNVKVGSNVPTPYLHVLSNFMDMTIKM